MQNRISELLRLLIVLLRDSANFKIRTHAASALMALKQRAYYGDTYADAVKVVAMENDASPRSFIIRSWCSRHQLCLFDQRFGCAGSCIHGGRPWQVFRFRQQRSSQLKVQPQLPLLS